MLEKSGLDAEIGLLSHMDIGNAQAHRSSAAVGRSATRTSPLLITAVLPLLASLGGCLSADGDACVGPDVTASQAVLDDKSVKPRNCDGSFLSARNQRGVLYEGHDQPRLWTGEGARAAVDIDPSRLNVPLQEARSGKGRVTGYLDLDRRDYAADDPSVAADIADLRSAAPGSFDPAAKVNLNFKKATVDFVLKQMLGGALGLNYVAPDDLGGSITFRTEEPIPKGQILQVLRDLLARQGLEMRKVNGVFQVGRPEQINSMEQVASAGERGDRVTRLVRLRGNVGNLVGLARQVMPPGVTVTLTNEPDTVMVNAAPADVDGAEAMLKGLAKGGLGADHTVVIPLRYGLPAAVAGQLAEFYSSRGVQGLTLLPLDQQGAILAASRDATTLNGVRRLAQVMDSQVTDEMGLRIVPLKYLKASEVAEKLATLFGAAGGGGGTGSGQPGSGRGSGVTGLAASSVNGSSLGGATGGFGPRPGLGGGATGYPTAQDGDLAPSGPSTAPPEAASAAVGGGTGATLGGGGGRGGYSPPSGGGGGGGSETKIVSDTASNSVMVYSSYSLFKRVRDTLQVLDVPQAQVVIEATIVEVTLNDQLQQGVQVFLSGHGVTVGSGDLGNPLGAATSAVAAATGTTATTGTTGTVGTTGTTTTAASGATNGFSANTGGSVTVGANFGRYSASAVIAALQGITKVKVISSPYLTVTNGKEARLVVGDQIPYSTRTQSANNLGNTTTTNEVTIKDTGIVLDITPEIHSNNEVELKISQSVSTPNAASPLGGALTPVISTRSVDSNVLLQSGNTVLLAGLIQDRLEQSEGGVPVLRTAPVIGDLFKSKSDTVQRTELILLLTPRVTRSASGMENITRLLQAQVHAR